MSFSSYEYGKNTELSDKLALTTHIQQMQSNKVNELNEDSASNYSILAIGLLIIAAAVLVLKEIAKRVRLQRNREQRLNLQQIPNNQNQAQNNGIHIDV